ncbi:MAG: hypothetical protein OHK0053_03150 [Microscillaceae bacterium]
MQEKKRRHRSAYPAQEANMYASEYQLYLPDKTLLKKKLKEWLQELEEN